MTVTAEAKNTFVPNDRDIQIKAALDTVLKSENENSPTYLVVSIMFNKFILPFDVGIKVFSAFEGAELLLTPYKEVPTINNAQNERSVYAYPLTHTEYLKIKTAQLLGITDIEEYHEFTKDFKNLL
ncbi:Uncharacterised protein [Oligella urethralis]|uniref:hypothetical protein n=1 Tax=Oligella urethralis TaxID=90245 RepID=UPI000E06859D|nr:hypothetical protein [Oligella urethralis]SUA63407.1 Uncharacterised protein [Oligella urethralis]